MICCDKVRTQSQHKAPFLGEIELNFYHYSCVKVKKNNSSGFVSQA